MGYEIKIIVAEKYDMVTELEGKDYTYCEKITDYNYCVDYDFADFIKSYPFSNCYTYLGNGEEVYKDPYGDELRIVPIEDMIAYLKEHADYGYRRFGPLLRMLEAFRDEKLHFRELVVLTYGY